MREATAEELEFAERWMASRGKRPYHRREKPHVCEEGWLWMWNPGGTSDRPQHLPTAVFNLLCPSPAFVSESAAIAALAVALAELKEAVAVPGPMVADDCGKEIRSLT